MRAAGPLPVDRFLIRRVLKEGSASRTYLAEDLARAGLVVAKVAWARELPLSARLRLEHEADVLGRIDSPRVAGLVEVIEDAEHLILVSRYQPGVDLADRLRESPLGLGDALRLGRLLLQALQDVHDHGVVHRDVKPANIVVTPGEVLSEAALVDFGLARSERLDPSLGDLPAGTARYMSPEAAGSIDAPVDERADLYAAGAVLFECLTGKPPFPGDRLSDVLRLHATVPPPDLASFGVVVPGAVEEVIRRLLAKDPADRYQTAAAAIADLDEIAEALDRGVHEPIVSVGRRDRRRTLAAPAFVGRSSELVALTRHLAAAAAGQGRLLLLEAESGGGKTRLLGELTRRVVPTEALLLRGQGVDAAARRPFEVLRGVAGGILAEAEGDPAFAVHLRDVLADRAPAVAAALPSIGEVLGVRPEAGAPEAFGEQRTLDALAALLRAVGRPERPAVVVLDDCQWADELALRLLLRWSDDAEVADDLHVCVISAFRSEEVEAENPLRWLRSAVRVVLGPLADDDVRRLVASMAGSVPEEAAELIAELAGGSPFMASAVLHGLVESGALVGDGGGWCLDEEAVGEIRASRQAGAVLTRRLVLLPAHSLALLRIAAILGKEFDLELATALLGHAPAVAGAALEEVRRRHLVWIRESTGLFVHDKIREAVLDGIDPAEAAALHRTAAAWLEIHRSDDGFALAHHWDAAGEPARALPYALVASREARGRHALSVAEDQLRIAARGAAAEGDERARREIAEDLGDVCMLRGRYAAAAEQLAVAEDLARDPEDRARVLGKLGELHFKRGDMAEARDEIELALRLIGRRVPRSAIGFLLAALAEVLVQAAHTALPRLLLGRRDPAGAEDDLVAVRLHSRLAHVYWFAAGRVATLWTHLRGMNLAERYPPGPDLAQAYSEHAPVMTVLTLFDRGVRYGERSLAIRRSLGDLWGEGQSRHFLGVVLYGASRFAECIESCREAVRLLELTGDRWEVNTARWHIAFARLRLGELEEAVEIARRVHADGVEIGDPQARGISLSGWAKASGGRVPAELVAAELAGPVHDVHTRAEVHQAEAIRLLAEGRVDEAVGVLSAARALVRDAGLRQEYVVALLPWLATARRRQVEEVPAWAPRQRRVALRAARAAAREAVRASRRYRNNLPHALRERALVAALGGRPAAARRLLDRSAEVGGGLGMRAEVAETDAQRRRLAPVLGAVAAAPAAPDAADLAGPADEQGGVEGRSAGERAAEDRRAELPLTLSLVDRFDGLLDGGRRISSARSAEAVHEVLCEVAGDLLRGERCLVVEIGDAGPLVQEGSAVSAGHIAAAVAAGRPVILGADPAADPRDSLVFEGVRSCLAAPIRVRGRTVACLYSDHRSLPGLFGQEEERLALLLTAIAGAALENAESFGELTALSQTLERRVEERTAELSASNRQVEAAYSAERELTEELTRLIRFKDDFMGMLAHDLRSPLTSIEGFAVTLFRRWSSLPEDQRLLLVDRLMRNARRATEFVENLLQFAHIESGTYRFDPRPYDLAGLVRRTVNDLLQTEPPVELVVIVPEDLPVALGDEQRHWQVLTNLLSNAVKFSPQGSVVTVRVTVGPDGRELRVDVVDEGAGIRAEDLPLLFRKFSRVEQLDARKRAVGTGLGLYICQSLVEGQGGRIWADSTEGRGSTFSFTVPVADFESSQSTRDRLPADATIPGAER